MTGVARPAADPVTRQIVKGALRSAQAEMETLLARTAMSPFIREKKDYFCALYDADARLVAGTPVPVFGAMIEPVLANYPAADMRPGDLYWYNDCYGSAGAVSHSPDQVFVAPVFAGGELVGYAQSWAHFNDIGGLHAGSLTPLAREIFHEGVIVPPVRLARDGVVNDELMRVFVRNSRFPAMVRGDVRACIAAVRLGERRLTELHDRFGGGVARACFDALIEETRAAVVDRLRRALPVGRYSFTDMVDRDGQGNGPFAIRFVLDVGPDRIALDARGADDQAPGPVNFLMSPEVPRMALGIWALSDDPGALLNAGALAALDEVALRPGSILAPRFPAPLGLRGITLIRVITASIGLLNVATGGGAVASSNVYVIAYLRGRDASGAPFLLTDGIAVGYGARPFADGIDAVYLVANENYPAEFLDAGFPVRLVRYALNTDSGGPGRWRGGCGVVREIEVLASEATFSIRIDSVVNPPWGVAGGMSGRGGRCIINPGRPDAREVAPVSDGHRLRRGDVVRIETGGGGGHGHPFDREPERVREDVLGGFVSRESARADYGVGILDDGALDRALTARLRADRPVAGLFHSGGYRDAMT